MGGLISKRWVKNISKKERLTRNGWRKSKRGACDPKRNYDMVSRRFIKLSIIKYYRMS